MSSSAGLTSNSPETQMGACRRSARSANTRRQNQVKRYTANVVFRRDWTAQIRMALSVAKATATDEYLPSFQQAMKQLAHCVAMLKTDARTVRHTDPSIYHNSIVRKSTKRLKAGKVHLRASEA